MKVLWVTNIIFPFPAGKLGLGLVTSGGWMLAMADSLRASGNVWLAVASMYRGKVFRRIERGAELYYVLPDSNRTWVGASSRLREEWRRVVEDFAPDLIHVHGTEYAHAIPLLREYPSIPCVASIQGLIGHLAERYLDGIDCSEITRFRTFRDRVRRDGMREQKRSFRLRGETERELFSLLRDVIGRTSFDRAHAHALNPRIRYLTNNENLRDVFYASRWALEGMHRHTLFVSQTAVPYKGFHFLLKAMPHVLRRFPDARVVAAGGRCFNVSTWKGRLREGGYGRYVRSLIGALGLSECVAFTGPLSADEMAERMRCAHVFVLPSCIENSPNSLGEAQLMGMPCVAAHVGGVPDMVRDGVTGLLYDSQDPIMLAARIMEAFSDDNRACSLGARAREAALARHDRETNRRGLECIYSEILRGASNSGHPPEAAE